MRRPEPKGTALITGAARGIGAVYADRIARRGCDLTQSLRRETGRSVTPSPADLRDKAELARAKAALQARG